MIIGCPREVKNHEYRVALTPNAVTELALGGHTVRVETHAGEGAGYSDSDYQKAGAQIVDTAAEAWESELVLKVKEPQPSEFDLMQEGQLLFTYLHLAAEPEVAEALKRNKVTSIAYENVTSNHGLPLLTPMSEVAGRLSAQVGAYHLMHSQGGEGVLLGGVPGTPPASVAIIGGGVAGEHAAQMAMGLGADVTILDVNLPRLRELSARYGSRLRTLASTSTHIAEAVRNADLVIGTVLIPGEAAPKLVTEEMVATMKKGAVLVDVAIDQGGCFAYSHPTTHDDPTFEIDGKVFYCVANMPGAVPRTSTAALTTATLPFVRALANGWEDAVANDPHLAAGLNTHEGRVVHPVIARELGEPTPE
ncbi:alanine dehydrogenase [Corynebacterium tapiri]|uniref:Alanine dehydrogenase n=1 Tax=Corynebacterium tapiri TaxID=1448266 RepID=A0A5C4U3L5_9CORY|nr:alanine dehydrogenase [Corynebacterium tapiri]TNL96807.1 alanine dehydrogenase [Corynebacterium tapiri]